MYFGLSACFWWCAQSFIMYMKVVWNMKDKTDKDKLVRNIVHAVCWGYPFLVLVVMLACRQIGFRPQEGWCFILDVSFESIDNGTFTREFWIVYSLFYLPVALLCIFGSYFMVAILWEILKVKLRVARHADNTGSGKENTSSIAAKIWKSPEERSKFIQLYRTPLLFLFFFLIIWAFIFSFRLQTDLNYSAYKDSAKDWIKCLLGNHSPLDIMKGVKVCGDHPAIVPDFMLQV